MRIDLNSPIRYLTSLKSPLEIQTLSTFVIKQQQSRNMSSISAEPVANPTNVIAPPLEVRGMTVLEREKFTKSVTVPYLQISVDKMKHALKILKPCLLKLSNLPPVEVENTQGRNVLLHPELFNEKLLYIQKALLSLNTGSVRWRTMDLTYENWSSEQIFKAVLPKDSTGNVSGYSVIGHIIHLNLKEDMMEYRFLVGRVLIDKMPNIKTVINKTNAIDSEYRNFKIELLAGEPDYETTVKENGFQYALDFSKVFWNPRLVQEHFEIVRKIHENDVVYDVFAGIGPFAVPAAKKGCNVHANDLNPESYKYLKKNAELNKVEHHIKCYNLDGKDFIQRCVKSGMRRYYLTMATICRSNISLHIIMNLPASALSFLRFFRGLITDKKFPLDEDCLPIIYCHFFKRKEEEAIDVVKEHIDTNLLEEVEITPVRLVAPNKMMMRLKCRLPAAFLISDEVADSTPSKKMKLDD